MNTEQVKQMIAIELEGARIWGALLIPSIALDLTLFFTEHFFADQKLVRYSLASYVFIWLLVVLYARSYHINRARKHVTELK